MSETQTSSTAAQRAWYKQQAAERAVEFVESGMRVGLGTGSTAIFATRRIAQLLQTGQLRDITGVATSKVTWEEAQQLGIPLLSEDLPQGLDLTIDGADEVDPDLNLIKGAGGALLREKIVAQASRRVIIVVDESKLSSQLGLRSALPVEVLSFGWRSQWRYLTALGAEAQLRVTPQDAPLVTDSGNLILDCSLRPHTDLFDLATKLNERAGIVEHGLFFGLTTDLIVAGQEGVRHLTGQARK